MSESPLEDSEVFPVGWSQCVLGDVVSLKSGFAYKSQDWVEDGVAVIKIANVRHGKVTLDSCSYVTDEVAGETVDFEVLDGHLLMTLTGEIGAIGIYKEHRPARLNQRVARIDLKLEGEHFFRYLCLFLESPHARELMWSKAQGMAQPNISPKEVLQIPFPLAPSDEQVKIVEILEEQLSRLDAALASVRAVREKSARFRRSLLQSAFNGALTGHDPGTGVLPNDWQCSRLDEVAKVQLGRQRSPKHHTGPSMRPYLRAANVTWKGLDVSDVSEMNFTDEEMETYRLKDGDILVNEASGSASEVGKAVVFRGEIEDCGFQNHLIRVRVTSVNPSYLYQFLVKNAVLGEYLRESQGVGINHLGKTKLASWPVPIPSLKEQMRIVEILEEQLSRLDASLEIADVIEKKALAFRRSLLQAAFSGNLTKEWREGAHV